MKFPAFNNQWTGGQFSVFRILFGSYLVAHFAGLFAWAPEIFSSEGMLADRSLSPLMHIYPNIFLISDSPFFIKAVIVTAGASALSLILGYKERYAALWMMYVLACLFGRNPLIANPSLPYVGFMLLCFAFIPSGPYGSLKSKGRADLGANWYMPKDIFLAAWVILSLTYSYSGYTKLLSPSWVAGENISYVLDNPLARDYFVRDIFLWMPHIFLKLLTWSVLYIELFFAFFALFPRLRPAIWALMLFIQLGFAFLLNFLDLTFAMIMFHLFTFDPGWIKAKSKFGKMSLFYDGECGFCHATVRFVLAEDKKEAISFSPLQAGKAPPIQTTGDTIILQAEDGSIFVKSTAVAKILISLGGLWTPLGYLLQSVPRPVRDGIYDLIGKFRKRIFARPENVCPMLIPEFRNRFIS